ncbi:hypothetical protein HOU00_gp258 [Caulobacter phage CcrPW]|uniref:Uncharacterized protein n=1 Tax=Caulobacter phage CcrPW TaxID=2283271 RepID=A0A385EDG7_9CAUD|nr:hypothetical protein HOU00_gp258 [Caulobacter phage CcrPW]AXQ68867.1 hypothetical protein CcrPW_gp328 [Caulobacter phage CcrPW]
MDRRPLYRTDLANALNKLFGEAPADVLDVLMESISKRIESDDRSVEAHYQQAIDYGKQIMVGHEYENEAFKALLDSYHSKPDAKATLHAFLEKWYDADNRLDCVSRDWHDPNCATLSFFERREKEAAARATRARQAAEQ